MQCPQRPRSSPPSSTKRAAHLRTLAACFDRGPLPNFEYEVAGSPCERVVGQAFRYIAGGVLAEIDPTSVFAEARLDSYAAFPLNDTHGTPLGVLAVMDREPLAGGDAAHAEVMLKVVAGRLGSELERRQTLEVMQSAALAVSGAQGDAVFDELVRVLAALLQLEFAFVACHDAEDRGTLKVLALHSDGRILHDLRTHSPPRLAATCWGGSSAPSRAAWCSSLPMTPPCWSRAQKATPATR